MGEVKMLRQNIKDYSDKELLEEYTRAQESVEDSEIPKPDEGELEKILELVEQERSQ